MHPLNKRLKSLVYELNFANKIEFVNLKKKIDKTIIWNFKFQLIFKVTVTGGKFARASHMNFF